MISRLRTEHEDETTFRIDSQYTKIVAKIIEEE